MALLIPSDGPVIGGIPLECNIKIKCSEDSRQKTIEEVASYISQIYARFITLPDRERAELYQQGAYLVALNDRQKMRLPSLEKVVEFEKTLKEKIIMELNDLEAPCQAIVLSVDLGPQKKLAEICNSIFEENLYFVLPWKTTTTISWNKKTSEVQIEMNLKTRLANQRVFC